MEQICKKRKNILTPYNTNTYTSKKAAFEPNLLIRCLFSLYADLFTPMHFNSRTYKGNGSMQTYFKTVFMLIVDAVGYVCEEVAGQLQDVWGR